MRRFAVIAVAAVLTGVVVGVVVAGGGDDDGGGGSQTVPELTPPPGSSLDESQTRTDRRGATGEQDSQGESGGAAEPTAPAPSTPDTGGDTAPPQDTEQNDTPPPSGSPAERFERFCEENPGAC